MEGRGRSVKYDFEERLHSHFGNDVLEVPVWALQSGVTGLTAIQMRERGTAALAPTLRQIRQAQLR